MEHMRTKNKLHIVLSLLLIFLLGIMMAFGPSVSPVYARDNSITVKTEELTFLGGIFDYFPLSGFGKDNISSPYGSRIHPISGAAENHGGIDIAAPSGTQIHACDDGVVIISTYGDGTGNYIVIDHGDGIYSEYMHQSERIAEVGDIVKGGDVIGLVGSTGDSTGPHLHIGVIESDTGFDYSKRVDPYPYLFGDRIKLEDYKTPVCIIAITDDASVFENEVNVIAHYGNSYLLEFDGVDKAKEAYQYYLTKVDAISYDMTVTGRHTSFDSVEELVLNRAITRSDNIFLNLEALNKENGDSLLSVIGWTTTDEDSVSRVGLKDERFTVGIEKTEAEPQEPAEEETQTNVTASSIIQDVLVQESIADKKSETSAELTKTEDENINVSSNVKGVNEVLLWKVEDMPEHTLWIDVLNENGSYNVSTLYSALQYAVTQDVKVVVLPMTAYRYVENAVIKMGLQQLIDKGVVILCAAGDDGLSLDNFVSENNKIVFVGTCYQNGVFADSNYGAYVDYNVVADNSSEALWKLVNMIDYTKDIDLDALVDNKTVFPTFIKEEPKEEEKAAETVVKEEKSVQENAVKFSGTTPIQTQTVDSIVLNYIKYIIEE